jgi:putative transposase
LCHAGKVSKSGYYKWVLQSTIENRDSALIEKIKGKQRKFKYTYGYRKMTSIINRESDIRINGKKILRIMRENNLLSAIRRKRKWYGCSAGEPKENILNRNFRTRLPNKKFVADVTEIKIKQKKIYLSAIMDIYNNEIVSYEIGRHNSLSLVSNTVENLICKKGKRLQGCIFHSDQGSQYTSNYTKNKLASNGIIQSMSRKGNPLDNACIENFFGVMKTETLYNKTLSFRSVEHFQTELIKWIDYYNYERIQKKLNYLSPIEYKKGDFA